MADTPDRDEKTEAPSEKRRREAAEKGDVLQSRELGTALVVLSGAIWFALAGPWMLGALGHMLAQGLRFDASSVRDFDPAGAALRLIGMIAIPLLTLFVLTMVAAVGTPALLGSLGFRWGAIGFKAEKINPLSGIRRIFGPQGLIELVKSLAKIVLLGGVGYWLLSRYAHRILGLGAEPLPAALGDVGGLFVLAVLVMALALAGIAAIDVPAQLIQRGGRLRMTKQEVKDEHKQTEGSPELKAALRQRQHEVLRGSARQALAEATVVLTNPTHFAVALRYRPGVDPAPVVVARGRGAIATALREMAVETAVPMLSYPQLTRAIYFTARTGQMIREDLYLAVATVIAFVFNLDSALADTTPPEVEVPPTARFDADGRRTGPG
ncbi:MAG TPA: flagellar type III secretion system protein FlhB [Sphingomonadaceae bacterium]|nr:flagellar type III secretion system protein FlhB [Sphingomonadaceae bacterium]